MPTVSYYTGFHLITTDDFNALVHKDPQALYCLIDAPVAKHNTTHFKDGNDRIRPEDIGAIDADNPAPFVVKSGDAYTFNISTPGASWGETVRGIRFFDGVNAQYMGRALPSVVLGDENTVTYVVSPTLIGSNGVRNILTASTAPTVSMGQNGDICVVNGGGLYIKSGGAWLMAASYAPDAFMPIAGGTFTGSVTFGVNLFVTGTAKNSGALYAGTENPTGTTRLNYDGYFYATRVYNAYMADYAECFKVDRGWRIGDIYCISNRTDIDAEPCSIEEDANVLGVISNEYAMCVGGTPDDNLAPIGLMGRVSVSIVGSCKKGDYIVSSSERGKGKAIASHMIDNIAKGAILGRALEGGSGTILMSIQRM